MGRVHNSPTESTTWAVNVQPFLRSAVEPMGQPVVCRVGANLVCLVDHPVNGLSGARAVVDFDFALSKLTEHLVLNS